MKTLSPKFTNSELSCLARRMGSAVKEKMGCDLSDDVFSMILSDFHSVRSSWKFHSIRVVSIERSNNEKLVKEFIGCVVYEVHIRFEEGFGPVNVWYFVIVDGDGKIVISYAEEAVSRVIEYVEEVS